MICVTLSKWSQTSSEEPVQADVRPTAERRTVWNARKARATRPSREARHVCRPAQAWSRRKVAGSVGTETDGEAAAVVENPILVPGHVPPGERIAAIPADPSDHSAISRAKAVVVLDNLRRAVPSRPDPSRRSGSKRRGSSPGGQPRHADRDGSSSASEDP